MNEQKSPVIAVVTALANGYTEKELLRGLISENKEHGYKTAVLSNIYNMSQVNEEMLCEQRIYDLACSEQISGIILFCESFVESSVRQRIAAVLKGTKVPMIGVGARIEEFEDLDMTLLNTSEEDDIYELTSHLIEVHSFTDIVMLTGMEGAEPSVNRAEGYFRALRDHGIEPDESKVYYGDFWLNSGEVLAGCFLSGELPMPQAVVCANDMMAYGMLRCFSENGIRVPDDITVVSYEYSDMRLYYSPPLTSLKRDHVSLGRAAAQRMQCILEGRELPEFIPPRGRLVFGRSCSCKEDRQQSLAELREAELRRNYSDLGLFSTMEQKLTLCRDMESFIGIIGEHHWMVRNNSSIYLCLYSDWYDPGREDSEVMIIRRVPDYSSSAATETFPDDLGCFFGMDSDAAVCYFSPLFSGSRYFGHMALMYHGADSYDDVYRHWLKSVSVGLEFLRLKNDINYLLDCQNVSEYRDTLTGMNNEKGIERAYQAVNVQDSMKLYFVRLRTDLFPEQFSEEAMRRKTQAVLGAAAAVRKFCGNNGISGRMKDGTFVCLVQSAVTPQMTAELLSSLLIQEKEYMELMGMNSFVCCAEECGGRAFIELAESTGERLETEYRMIASRRRNRYYSEMLRLRNMIYSSPEITFSPDSVNIPAGSTELFRRNYKECFGITFHQDCIAARIARAEYQLAATSVSISEISEKCGYIDHKYFQRQFAGITGIPPLKYRSIMKM